MITLTQTIEEFSKVNMKKSRAFIYTKNSQLEHIMESNPM